MYFFLTTLLLIFLTEITTATVITGLFLRILLSDDKNLQRKKNPYHRIY